MMKKLFLWALLAIFTLPMFAKHVDVENARTVARSFWEQNLGKQTRATFSDVTSQTEFTNFYIFNTGDGFVIVSADDIAVPILGYSDAGNFDPQNIPVNMYEWLQGYENDINRGISNGVPASAEIVTNWTKLSRGQGISPKRSRSVEALVQTRWNQGSPYNNLCPYDNSHNERTVTGCVATAMAQIMKYWNYPTQGNGTQTYTHETYGQQTANFGSTTYDWNNMVNTYSNSATQAQKNAVATLMYHCGVAVMMDYGISSTGGSGAVTVGSSNGTAEYALKTYFLYKNTLNGCRRSDYTDQTWKNMLTTDLDAGRPVIYTGRGEGGGHCFICDGYNNSDQFHFNWGWGGYCDGFYAINSLEPGVGGIGSAHGTYNESQSAIFGIEPNAGLFAIPNALTFSGLGDSKTFMVRSSTASSQSWSASSNQSWLTITPSTGAGSGANTTVTATASRNNTANERTATVTITQGSATTTVTVVQPSGVANNPGCFGYDGNFSSYKAFEQGNMVVLCSEGYGYYTTGHAVTKVRFTTYDGGLTSGYTDYTNNSFTIKIYEGGSTESLSSGYTSNIAGAMGTQVYSQNYTQSYFGEQEVTLNTPYIINENNNFWIAIVANGKTLFALERIAYGSPISAQNYEGSSEAFDGKYLYSDTEDGTDYLNLNATAYYTDDTHSTLQLYTFDFLMSFCTIDPSLLSVTPETLDFASEGGSLNFTVKANNNVSTRWNASSSASWLTLSATSGNGSGATTTVTATATENVSGSDRTATITITQGSETKVVTVSQPDGSLSDVNIWYGNTEGRIISQFTNGYQIIIRPENFGNYAAGNKILKVKFTTYNGMHAGAADYVNTSFTVKIYENSSIDANLINNGLTSNIDGCLGTLAYSQNYTSATLTEDDYFVDHVVELETPYTIREGVNFWISVVANGNTLFAYDRDASGDVIEAGSFTNSMAVSRASMDYLITISNNGNDYLKSNYSASYTDNTSAYVQTYSNKFRLSYYISDGDTPYVESSDVDAWLMDDDVSPHLDAAPTMTIGATDNIVLYPVAHNMGPETASGTISTAITIGSETIDEVSFNTALEKNYIAWIYGSVHSYNITAETLNQMVITGTFDVCLHVNYSGFDPDLSNNVSCITVTRATPSFTISASANPTAGGTVAGAGTYELGEGVNLVATPNAGYRFTNWTENGNVVSTTARYQFTATSNRTLVANFTQITYNVTATVDPANSGTISGNNSPYTYGNNVSLTANANTGYTFVNWTDEDANVVSTNANYQFTIDGNRTFVAHFERAHYQITATANPTAGGTVSGAGSFEHGQSVTLTATANTGYTFTNWTENGSVVSSNAQYTFTATRARNLVANFQINTYNISATANPSAAGSVSGIGSYNHGQTVTLSATANTGYNFVNWTENGSVVSTNTTYSFTATANKTLVANFEAISYTIAASANPTNGGTVSGAGNYTYGQNVTLRATANTGYHFVNWTENGSAVSTNANYSFTANANRTLVANFQINTYTISANANPVAGGTVNGAGEYTHGQTVNLSAVANTGYNFVNWTENGTAVSTNASYSFTATANKTLVANFELINYTISATANPTNGGTIEGAGDYNYGQNVTLSATANTGYTFVNWTEDGAEVSTNATYSFTVTDNRTLVANFQINTYTISATANPTEGGTIEGDGEYTHGQNVTLNATANTGYTFVNWTESGEVVSTNAEYSFTATVSRTLVANFQINTYNISATANPNAGGTISGAGEYTHGENVTLTATANTGYDFVNWTENGSVVSTETSISFTATADRNLVANFSIESYTISATASPSNGGTVSGTGEYDYGQTVILSATPSTGYHFVNWTENGVEVSTDAEYSFTATANRTLVANFEINRYHVTATANDPTKGNVTIEGETTDGMYDHGTVLVMTATATEGNHFVAWNDGVTDAQREYTVVADVDFVANFAQDGVVSYIITATANPTDGGTITGVGPYEENTTVTLNAIASDGYSFANWTENDVVVSTDAEYSFTATADRTLVANFTINTYTIIASASEGGSILPDGVVVVNAGADAIFTILANEGYRLVSVIVDADTENEEDVTEQITGQLIEPVYTFTNVNANHTIHATFEAIPAITYTISVSIQGNGTVTFGENEIVELGTVTVEEGATPTFTFIPDEGYRFSSMQYGVDGGDIVYNATDEVIANNGVFTLEAVDDNMVMFVEFVPITSVDMLEAGSIAVYPNPNNGKFILSMESIEGDVTCQIVNANGSVVETREMSATDGSEFVFDCNVAPGAYFVRVISGDRVWTKSVVINR